MIVATFYTMSLRPSAPEFQPHSTVISVDEKDSHVISMPDLGYEFPYIIEAMPLPAFTKIVPTKRVWTEMATSVVMHLKH
jgi:hypothetical protein